ncbi:probable cytochrome P450 6a20 [Tribolium castaneum]|uniref:probable cytochrome P450 6a20 n=1 Tax=Tribolium castaneum TaxID=7070 RepID=UPI0000D55E38|nr:PREDICTED: probable cytochrome P450 6a20 [Tribolium castaneum]|eukprot:XP_015834511.1 PREDICTED: probable cytochrome P450 6a20 [Tribolium castaneum]
MLLVNGSLTYDLVAILATVLAGLVVYYKWAFTYWKRRGLEYLEPSIPFGNCASLLKLKYSFGEQFAEFYKQFREKNLRHGGVFMFARPFYIPVDPAIMKDIMQKDFQHFVDRGFYVNEEHDPLSGHLFSLEGNKWKNLRAKLTATFTSGKMKMMFETMSKCAEELDNYVNEAAKREETIDIKETLARFTTDIISSCAFGLESNCLKNPDTQFRYYGKRTFQNTTWENFKDVIQFITPTYLLDLVKFKITKPDVEDYMLNLVKKTVDYREKNNVYRKDFLHLLLQLKNKGKITDDETFLDHNNKSKEVALTINELAAQVFVFFAAGYETSSTAMTFTLYELCLNQKIQDKLREEIKTVLAKHNNKISYEAIMEMTYMDQALNETLRKYPPVPVLNRKCTKAYDVAGTNLHLDEGTMVVLPILGLQHDPEYYPDPSKYDPDRFSEENKNSRPPFTWMPFGEGPRICIGLRFGMLQAKVGLATLLGNYKVTLSQKTQTPLEMDCKAFITTTKEGIWLDFTRLN